MNKIVGMYYCLIAFDAQSPVFNLGDLGFVPSDTWFTSTQKRDYIAKSRRFNVAVTAEQTPRSCSGEYVIPDHDIRYDTDDTFAGCLVKSLLNKSNERVRLCLSR